MLVLLIKLGLGTASRMELYPLVCARLVTAAQCPGRSSSGEDTMSPLVTSGPGLLLLEISPLPHAFVGTHRPEMSDLLLGAK